MLSKLLTEVEVSEITGRKIPTLQEDRRLGGGIQFVRLGRQIRYEESAVEKWIAERRFSSTSEYKSGQGNHKGIRARPKKPIAVQAC